MQCGLDDDGRLAQRIGRIRRVWTNFPQLSIVKQQAYTRTRVSGRAVIRSWPETVLKCYHQRYLPATKVQDLVNEMWPKSGFARNPEVAHTDSLSSRNR